MAVAATTFVTCFAVSAAGGTWWGGLTWPYISDTGREPPEAYVFGVGLTLASLLAAASATSQRRQLLLTKSWLVPVAIESGSSGRSVCGCLPVSAMITGGWLAHLAALPFGITVGWVSTRTSIIVHFIGALGFFFFTLVAVACNTLAVGGLVRLGASWLYTSLVIKRVLFVCAAIAFVVHVVIGNIIVCESPNDDGVFDYRGCLAEQHVITVSQHAMVYLFLAILGTYALDKLGLGEGTSYDSGSSPLELSLSSEMSSDGRTQSAVVTSESDSSSST
ncbi:uncharacterized protein AMSG_01595, partial [Thecamonas trahens ATCC 50062]